ncbi:MAG: hydrogenase nickel incorporation protein HypB [Desulfurococcales archaeon]|nr:hydrogenase nickel incorporation protein HypB [Desulfurococcales archaeon]
MVEKIVFVAKDVIKENERLAMKLREFYDSLGLVAYEFLGGPGSGKTSLIEKLVERFTSDFSPSELLYIDGDVATSIDSERMSKHGIYTVQINTGGSCHLEVPQVKKTLMKLGGRPFLEKIKVMIIENVGNMICPFSFPLGAHARIMVADVAEGEDKFIKHPLSTRVSDIIVINKVDLAEYLGVNIDKMKSDAYEINPRAPVYLASAKTGYGIDEIYQSLMKLAEKVIRTA